jgi:hypothetical protein
VLASPNPAAGRWSSTLKAPVLVLRLGSVLRAFTIVVLPALLADGTLPSVLALLLAAGRRGWSMSAFRSHVRPGSQAECALSMTWRLMITRLTSYVVDGRVARGYGCGAV